MPSALFKLKATMIYNASNHNMDLPDESVDLIVTSPPYWNSIAYDVHSKDPNQFYRTRESSVDYQGYLHELAISFWECYRVIKPGRVCAVVIGTVLDKGKHIPLPFHFTRIMENLGWEFRQDIIWHKCTGGVKRAGAYIQNPYAGYYYPNIMTEYILVFRKPGPPIYAEKERGEPAEISTLFTMEIANNIWHIAPVPPNTQAHPCPFPSEIPYRLISLYSYEGETVLDPFCGIGTTLIAAQELERAWIGYDTCVEYCLLANTALAESRPCRRSEQLIARFDKLPTEGGQKCA